ncbi:hypothetical protein [Nocardioides alcanivorans]|uniref:hypothetical protein n=1 Tax=Nocardioides alcanivorans TaxID=2897352 RepID=UPI001F3A7FC8|nr:hypothetical protein [Nocardioides alcanivorans]
MADQDLAEIHEELTVDHVYVHPSLRSLVSEADEAALEDQVAQTADPTYVVVWPFRSGDTYGGKASDLLTRLHHAYPEPGIYLSTTTQLEATDYSGVRVDGRQFGVAGEADGRLGDYSITSIVDLEKHQDLPSALSRTVEVLEMEPAERDELHDELLSQHRKEYLAENPRRTKGPPSSAAW